MAQAHLVTLLPKVGRQDFGFPPLAGVAAAVVVGCFSHTESGEKIQLCAAQPPFTTRNQCLHVW